MISLLKEYLDKPFDSLYRDLDETLKVRIRITNILIIVGIFIIFLFTLQNAFILKFPLAFVFNFFTIIFFFLSLRWNLRGQYRLGITVFTFSAMIAAILPGCFLPYLANYEYIFLGLVGAPIILIPSDMKIQKWFGVFLCILGFVLNKFVFSKNEWIQMNEMELFINNIFLTTVTFVTILVAFMFWERLTLKMKSELIRKHEILMNNNQLANLGLLSGGIAHELNNPLTIILGFNEQSAKLIKDKNFDLGKLQDQIEKQAGAIERVVKIVKAFQSMALDQTEGEKLDEDINEIVKDVHRLSKGTASNLNIEIKLELSEENCFVNCHRTKVAGAMINILDNAFFALKSTPSPEVTIKTRCDEDYSYISISNNGPPIHPDLAKKIMVPYFTTKKVSSGTGLGLSLSSRILEDHGGELIFDSQASLTTFILKLPMSK